MIEKPTLDKKIFNQDDFERLGWHDSFIHSISFNENDNSLIFNIDYIIQWIHPDEHKRDNTFDFWVSPAILIFKDVYNWEMNVKADNSSLEFDILEISRERSITKPFQPELYNYYFECGLDGSEIRINNNLEFEMYILAEPIYCLGQTIDKEIRDKIMKENIDFLLEKGLL